VPCRCSLSPRVTSPNWSQHLSHQQHIGGVNRVSVSHSRHFIRQHVDRSCWVDIGLDVLADLNSWKAILWLAFGKSRLCWNYWPKSSSASSDSFGVLYVAFHVSVRGTDQQLFFRMHLPVLGSWCPSRYLPGYPRYCTAMFRTVL
jgi:hypothetical protein